MNKAQLTYVTPARRENDTIRHTDLASNEWKERVLLCDFNILGSATGGQTYYGNLIASHPETLFSSLGEKTIGAENVPHNFKVISYRPDSTSAPTVERLLAEFRPSDGSPDILAAHRDFLKHLVSATARFTFDRLDVPIYFPFVGAIRKITKSPIRLTLHGMVSDGLLGAYEGNPYLFATVDQFTQFELASLRDADEIVSVSQLHKDWVENTFRPGRDISVIPPRELLGRMRRRTELHLKDSDSHNLYILSVGRLDGIKRPHDIIALRSRIRAKHPRFIVMGMPLAFMTIDTGELLKSISSLLEVRPPQPAWWTQFSPNDTVVVVPGMETFSYAAVEAVLYGFTTALAPTVGVRELFDRFGISYLKLEDHSEIRPLEATLRRANAEALDTATRMS